MAKGHRARGDGGAMASKAVGELARRYAREVADLRGRGLAPSGEAVAAAVKGERLHEHAVSVPTDAETDVSLEDGLHP